MNLPFNVWGVVVSAVAGMVVGSIWYGPLFGKKYMSAIGMDSWSPEKKESMRKAMMKMYVMQFLASLVTYWVLSGVITYKNVPSVSLGMGVAFWMWLGFFLPVKYGETLWGGSNKTLAWLNIGGNLVSLLVAGAIIGAMN